MCGGDRTTKLFVMGLVTNLLNPKIAVLYIALLPQFIDHTRGNVAAQSLALGIIQITVALIVNALIVLGAGFIARFLRARPLWLSVQRYLMGGVLGALAVKLATDRSTPATA
ncbi:LysE family translocator [Actinophytocola sp.]|uniref:LysE family translocator n=1 Tax=Actinophytocola sp. TaxID=1872138 RepID=UPI003D6A602B